MDKTIKKFTSAQIYVLNLLYDKDKADYFDVMRVGGNGATMKKLVDTGLISLIDTPESYKEWKITQAGRFAKENEFHQKNMLNAAYLLLIDKINEGMEFPDATYHVAAKCGVEQKTLEKLYDKNCLAKRRS